MTRHVAPASRVWNQSQDTTGLTPLGWWRGIRKQVGANASSLSFKLGRIYKFPSSENRCLFQSQHTAGADVQMTIHVIEVHFDRVMGKALRGTIDSFFLSPVPGGREPPQASLELSTPESNQSGEQILEIRDDEWMSVVDEQGVIHELEELKAEINTGRDGTIQSKNRIGQSKAKVTMINVRYRDNLDLRSLISVKFCIFCLSIYMMSTYMKLQRLCGSAKPNSFILPHVEVFHHCLLLCQDIVYPSFWFSFPF